MTTPFYIMNSREDYDKHVATGLIWDELGNDGWELVSTEKNDGDVWGFFKKSNS